MLLKIASLMLVLVAVVAIFGGLRLRKPGLRAKTTACPGCGRPRIGSGACPCGHGKQRG